LPERAHVGIARVDVIYENAVRDATVFLPIENYGRVTSPHVTIGVQSLRLPSGTNVPDYNEVQNSRRRYAERRASKFGVFR